VTALPVFAQEVPGGEAVAAVFWTMLVVAFIPFYIYWALATQIIAKKTNTENGWLAWIPIANVILWLDIAMLPRWWIILLLLGLFFPFASVIIGITVWMDIAEARKKPNWWGILVIVPVVQLIVPGYLAWTD
jgi:hypothetical protein